MAALAQLRSAARALERLEDRRELLEQNRDALIRAALEEGHSLRTVGAAAQVSHGTVALIRDRAS